MRTTRKSYVTLLPLMILILAGSVPANPQTTAFTYQGKLNDNSSPANGSYDLQFKLFDTLTSGTQQGSTQIVTNITVTAGIFTTIVDFGSTVFSGPLRFLEIAVKKSADSSFITLSPRQVLASNPYGIRSLTSGTADGLSIACVNCITSSQIQSVQGSQVAGTIPVASVPAGSGNYIQNTTSLQSASNFNIDGKGSANTFDATTQFNLGGSRVLSNPGTANLFAGVSTGAANSGSNNSFFGASAGSSNTTGNSNSFFGQNAGLGNTGGSNNVFVGKESGQANTTGFQNSFFGTQAGFSNTTGSFNSFFGRSTGLSNTIGIANSFFGQNAGGANSSGNNNSFFANSAGTQNTTGSDNSFFGLQSGEANTTGSSNSFFGENSGFNNVTGSNNTFVGINAGNPNAATQVSNSTAIGAGAQVSTNNTIVLGTINETTQIPGNVVLHSGSITSATGLTVDSAANFNSPVTFSSIFAGTGFTLNSRSTINGAMTVFGTMTFGALPAGTANVCFAPGFTIAVCGSSLRYKTNIASYHGGLQVLNRLKPVTFTWKQYGTNDIGLVAEDVAEVEPLFTFTNDKGVIEGVKYDHLSALFINAFKEQQAQLRDQLKQIGSEERQVQHQQREIEQYRKRLDAQQHNIEALERIVCLDHPRVKMCKEWKARK